MNHRIFGFVTLCAALVAACTTRSQAPTPAFPGAPTFPDFTTYTAVDADDFGLDLPNPGRPEPLHLIQFKTSKGISCGLTPGAYCMGSRLPGVPIEAPLLEWSDGTGYKPRRGTFTASTEQPIQAENSEADGNAIAKTLPARHAITFRGNTCGTDRVGGIACIDPLAGGFLLTQGWAGWLGHVTQGQVITAAPLTCSHDNDTTTCRQGKHGFSFTSKPWSYQSL